MGTTTNVTDQLNQPSLSTDIYSLPKTSFDSQKKPF